MRTTRIFPKAGLKGWVISSQIYPSPEGLPQGTAVDVMAKVSGTCELIVRDGNGEIWTVRHWQVDVGLNVETLNGEMVPEWNPLAWEAIDHEMAVEPAGKRKRSSESQTLHVNRLQALKLRGMTTAKVMKELPTIKVGGEQLQSA